MPGPRQISKRSAPKRSTPKRSTPKRSTPKSKRSAPKRSAAKRSASKQSASKQSASKQSASKRSATKQSASKRSASKQSASKRSASKRSALKHHVSKRKRYSLRSHSVRFNYYFGQNAQLLKSLNEKEKDVLKSLLGAARLENFSQTKKVAKLLAHKKNMEIIHKKLIEYAIMAKEDKNYELIDNAFKVLPILHNRFNAVWLDVQEMKKPPAIIHQEV